METAKETTPVVDAIGQIAFEGNVIPHLWYQNIILKKTGKPDLIAIILLAEVIYWYRPSYRKDEVTGHLKEIRRKFKREKWQRTTQSLADQFGLSRRQITNALARLESAGLIVRTFRNDLRSKTGVPMSNLQFIEPVPINVSKITYGSSNELPALRQQITRGLVTGGGTYTEIPTEIPTEKIGDAKTASPAPTSPRSDSVITSPDSAKADAEFNAIPRAVDSPPSAPALTAAAQEFFKQFSRKRWGTPAERALFERTEAEVGADAMLEAIRWAAENRIARVPAICTAARKGRSVGSVGSVGGNGNGNGNGHGGKPSFIEIMREGFALRDEIYGNTTDS